VFGVVVLAADQGDRPVLGVLGVGLPVQGRPVIQGRLGIVLQIGLVAQAPQDNAGVVLVPGDQVGQHLAVMPGQGIGLVGVALRPADAHCGGLVDDQD